MTVRTPVPVPKATLRRRLGWPVAGLVLIALFGILWAARHVWLLVDVYTSTPAASDHEVIFETVWATTFGLLLFQLVLAWSEPVYKVSPAHRVEIDALTVTINVPVYNEDPVCLHRALMSLVNQSRLPQRIEVVDDGSTTDYGDIREEFLAAATAAGIRASWVRQDNAGKRRAQAVTFTDDDADVYITVDSDTLLAYEAIEEGMKPFADKRVMSVAGLYLGLNSQKNFITRIAELLCVSWQLQGRSASSTMGSVVVNSGAFALYRGWVFRKYMTAYLNETFFGREVRISDDAYITMFCLLNGRTVQQPTAIALTLYPERFSNYCRQYVRWMRGSFIRSFWRLRYLPANSYAFWMQAISLAQFTIGCMIFVAVYLYLPAANHSIWPYTLAIPMLLGYIYTSRYLLLKRSDVSNASLWISYAMAPLMILWSWFICRPIRIYASMTFLKTGWVTRGDGVEVALDAEPVGRAMSL